MQPVQLRTMKRSYRWSKRKNLERFISLPNGHDKSEFLKLCFCFPTFLTEKKKANPQQQLTSTARSACVAPLIIFGTNDLCPGASRIVKCFFSVSKNARPHSTVLPFSRSSSFVSSAHDKYRK